MNKVLHLSHTDIQYDSRILKEMTALANSTGDYKLIGIGVKMAEGSSKSTQASDLELYSINLLSRSWTFLPKIVRHTITINELIVKAFIKALKTKPEIVHCHDTVVLPLGVLLKIFAKSKLVYDAHELESNRNGLSRILSKLTLYAEKGCWRFVDFLVTVSPSINKWYQENIGNKQSVVILNSPVLSANYQNNSTSAKNYFRFKYNIPADEKIFVYVGILGKGRGLEKILDVFSMKDRTSHVVFMGYGDLSELIREKEREFKNIHYHEAVPHESVVQFIRNADIGLCLIENVSLSDYFCLPNKLFEYCFAGIPVLASNFPDISDMVDKYNLGICCDLEIDSIKNAIQIFEKNNTVEPIEVNKLFEVSWESQEIKLLQMYKIMVS